jgi:hypothetical protein
MALFSRGSKSNDAGDEATTPSSHSETTPPADAETTAHSDAETTAPGAQEPSAIPTDDRAAAATVGISTSSYGGFGVSAPAAPSAVPTGEAPAPTQTIPGLPDNVVLRAALAALGTDPEGHEVLNVARQLLQGNVYLRVKGNAQELMNAGAELPLAIASRDEGNFVMVYSSGEALAAAVNADGDTETSAMGQAAPAVLRYVLQGGFAGVIVDHASAPASVVLPRALFERMFAEMDESLTLKRLVTEPRTAQTAAAVANALVEAPIWIAVNRASEDDEWGVAESRTDTGERILPVFSHPLEVVALGRGDQPVRFSAAQLGSALRDDTGIAGIVVDPAGPWIRLDRADLAPVLALPEPAEGGTAEDGAADAAADAEDETDAEAAAPDVEDEVGPDGPAPEVGDATTDK